MGIKRFLIGCFLVPIICSCTEKTHISFCCEKDKKNNYILKWEVSPEKEDTKIDIYSSDNDSVFPTSPYLTANVNDYIAAIKPQNVNSRNYFQLKVGNTYSGIITNRFFEMDSIQNLRDVGGYFTSSNEQVRWGKVYRSGNLSKMSKHDEYLLKSLKIKSIIDFRDKDMRDLFPETFRTTNYFPLNIESGNLSKVKGKIIEGNFLRGDAIVYIQDTYKDIIDNHAEQYANFFEILDNTENYPILFHCHLGKDHTGLATFFLMKALDIPTDLIEEDYLLSNAYIDKIKLMKEAQYLPEPVQEALTMITIADVSYLRYAISCMKKKSGSVDQYMNKELRITPEKKARLKNILLY